MSAPPPILWRTAAVAAVLLAAATVAAYWNSLTVPFVFDDLTSIQENVTIRQLWPLTDVLATPRGTGQTVDGRPLLNLSFALNYAWGRLDVRSYHVVNIAIHAFATFVLFGIARRTLQQPGLRARYGGDAVLLAFAIAVLWALHPLHTGAVTYLAQRAESLMGLCFLLTLYCFIRSIGSTSAWQVAAVAACFAGVLAKEVMAVVPLLVLCYDRMFVADSFRSALRQRRVLYASLTTSWLVLAWLLTKSTGRAATAGFDTDAAWWRYALTQCEAIVHYLRLAFWPHPLVFDYGTALATDLLSVLPALLAIAVLLAATVWAIVRRSSLAFLGLWFLLILAPTSSIVPVATQTVAEHRMYLPLAAVIALVVLVLYRQTGPRVTLGIALVFATGLGAATVLRNRAYHDEVTLWRDTAAKVPTSSRAFTNLGAALVRAGNASEALRAFEQALQLDPANSEAHSNLGNLLALAGRTADAIAHHESAVTLNPDSAAARANLASALLAAGRGNEAVPHFAAALAQLPDRAELHLGYGGALSQQGATGAAITAFETALRLRPEFAEAHYNLGNALLRERRMDDSIRHFQSALRINPDYIAAHNNLGNVFMLSQRAAEALPHFQKVVQLRPDSADAHTNLGLAHFLLRDFATAEMQFRTALRLNPDYEPARTNLERLTRLRR